MNYDKLALRGLLRDVSGQDCADPITTNELHAIGYAAAARANSVDDIASIIDGIRQYATEHGWRKGLAVL